MNDNIASLLARLVATRDEPLDGMPPMNFAVLINPDGIEAAAALRAQQERIGELERVLTFVSTDPCFRVLGSVTHDEVRAALAPASNTTGGGDGNG